MTAEGLFNGPADLGLEIGFYGSDRSDDNGMLITFTQAGLLIR